MIIANTTKVNHMNENKIAKATNSQSESKQLHSLEATSTKLCCLPICHKNLTLGINHVPKNTDLLLYSFRYEIIFDRSLGALRAPTSSWRPFEPALDPLGLLNFVLQALRPCEACDCDWIRLPFDSVLAIG